LIEVNLLPRSQRRSRRRSSQFGLLLPALRKLPGRFDRWLAFAVVAWVVAPAAIAYMYFGAQGRKEELNLGVEQAVQDSIHYATVNEAARVLRARRDTIAEKLAIIEEFDAARYTWAHIMDEVSRAMPNYIWLRGLSPTSAGVLPGFAIDGRAANNFALTSFMQNLEASPFIREVRLQASELVSEGTASVYAFQLTADYEVPPPSAIQTVPYLTDEEEP
jgi:Tfp pilus assembly protein PilN